MSEKTSNTEAGDEKNELIRKDLEEYLQDGSLDREERAALAATLSDSNSPEMIEQTLAIVQQKVTMTRGPLPPPEMLEKYEDVLPGAADRIISMAEAQSRHRQELEKTALHAGIRADARGVYAAAFLTLAFGLLGGFLVVNDKDLQGIIILVGELVSLAGLFAYSRWTERSEREDRPESGTPLDDSSQNSVS